MPISQIPPWLNVGPTDYLQAVHSGTQAGLEVARVRAAAQEAAARRMAAQQQAAQNAWEFGERLRQQAQLAQMEDERQRQYQSGMLDWRREQMRLDAERAAQGDAMAQARLDETMRHNLATEALGTTKAESEPAGIVTFPEFGERPFIRQPSGTITVIPDKDKPMSLGEQIGLQLRGESLMRPGAGEIGTEPAYQSRTNRIGQLMSMLPSINPAETNVVPQMGTLKPLDRQTAIDLLKQAGGDKEKARQLARQLGYTF